MSTPASPDVIVCGLNVVDVLFIAPPEVRKDSKHEIKHLTIQGGAPAGNAALMRA